MGKQATLRRQRRDSRLDDAFYLEQNVEWVKTWPDEACVMRLLNESKKIADFSEDRRVYLGVPASPVFIAIGKRLNQLGGLPLMQSACEFIRVYGKAYTDHCELSALWHGIGDWMH